MATHTDHAPDFEQRGEIPKPQTRAIWKTFIILVIITSLEFIVAFTMDTSTVRTTIFIMMTILKAYFIVAYFMHLKYEAKGLVWVVLVPMALIVWLMVALISEGSYYFESVTNYFR